MKVKKQLSLPSKYWLLIVTGICIVFIGLSLISDKAAGPLKWIADYTVIPMQKGINKAGMFLSDVTENFETLEEVKKELKQEGKNFKEDIEVGIMIEVPSAVLMADIFAQEVDFFSIGTNDLTQYILAADRLSETVSDMYDSYNPAVLRAVFQIKEAADKYGKSVSICGEMAGQQKAIVAFLSMGITNLSMVSGSILAARALIRNLDYTSLKPLRTKILQCRDSNEVKEILKNYI